MPMFLILLKSMAELKGLQRGKSRERGSARRGLRNFIINHRIKIYLSSFNFGYLVFYSPATNQALSSKNISFDQKALDDRKKQL